MRYAGLILLTLLVGCEKNIVPPLPPRPALVMIIGEKAEVNTMALVGEVRPRYESGQGFRINGKIIERKVDVGARVKKGQLIARLDAADIDLKASAASADVRAAEADYALAVAEAERQRKLFAKKFLSASSLELKEAELKTAGARLAQAKAQADVAYNQTHYANLTADRDGVVTQIRAEPGQVVAVGEIVVQIADTDAIEVSVSVPESRMSEVKPKAAAAIKIWANGQKKYAGVVREIAPAADSATRAFNVLVTIGNPDSAVKLGMTASVEFNAQRGQQTTGFRIPTGALTEIDGKKIVWVIDAENKAQPREVVAGQFEEDGVWIAEGLRSGEKIAIAGVHTLIKDQQVTPIVETAS
ncbi:MAG: efflux RND transporter periplasmic adaptor subunit [Gammaproteobacteria bacterium]